MAERVIWAAGWTLLFAVVMSLAAIVTLTDTTTEQTIGSGAVAECRPLDVMLGRDDGCEAWPTGRAMPLLLLTALVAALGVPEGSRLVLTRLVASLGVVVASIIVLTTLDDLSFMPRTWTFRLTRGVLLVGFLPFFVLPFALRYDVVKAAKGDRRDQTGW